MSGCDMTSKREKWHGFSALSARSTKKDSVGYETIVYHSFKVFLVPLISFETAKPDFWLLLNLNIEVQ